MKYLAVQSLDYASQSIALWATDCSLTSEEKSRLIWGRSNDRDLNGIKMFFISHPEW